METIHLVSHTHWDREWYLPFQVFRLKLVRLMDGLLELLEQDPGYRYFMLDGQTIVLDDYLQVRPGRRAQLQALVRSGRLLIGPWHILPDEFLVSPEATIRNLLQGRRTAAEFGAWMPVGYIPDPFGHIGQMPQILRGFGLETACVQRGLSSEPCEFIWQAPDGSQVFMAYLRDGYGNAAGLQASDLEGFRAEVERLAASLAAHSTASHRLLMQGTDHMEPLAGTPAALAYTNERLSGARVLHSNLPDYLDAVRTELAGRPLPVVTGELRDPRRFHLLPGVLSARLWIKQRNHACETLLEYWAEPFSVWAAQALENDLAAAAEPLRLAWRLLMECHPHDSICGCSIDPVHAEMQPRFDQVEQLGEALATQSLEALAGQVDTRSPGGVPALAALVVFNPLAQACRGLAQAAVQLPGGGRPIKVVDETGRVLPHRLGETSRREIAQLSLTKEQFQGQLGSAQGGAITGMPIQAVHFQRSGGLIIVRVELAEAGESNPAALAEALPQVLAALADPAVTQFHVSVGVETTRLEFLAGDVPGCGYRTFWVRPALAAAPVETPSGETARPDEVDAALPAAPAQIRNELLTLTASPRDGSLALTDHRTGAVFRGLNRFIDGGDCGDTYNYCPPPQDRLVAVDRVVAIGVERSPLAETLLIRLSLPLPTGLAPDRQARSAGTAPMQIVTRITLIPGLPRVEIHTQVENPAGDHRLRVHFPAPFGVSAADYDGHFQVVRRPMGSPDWDASWAEQPRPEVPQRGYTYVQNGSIGLAVANRGLPEVEVLHNPAGEAEIALTLLRCVGWLSRDDFSNRRGHAGPGLSTPGAQMIGGWAFDYAVIPTAGEQDGAAPGGLQVFQQAHAFDTPLRVQPARPNPGPLPSAGSFLQVEPPGFVLSAVKISEDGRGWIVRGYNRTAGPVQARLRTTFRIQRAEIANLAEKPLAPLDIDADGSLAFPVRAFEIVTLRLS